MLLSKSIPVWGSPPHLGMPSPCRARSPAMDAGMGMHFAEVIVLAIIGQGSKTVKHEDLRPT